jgi:hypothetical protein
MVAGIHPRQSVVLIQNTNHRKFRQWFLGNWPIPDEVVVTADSLSLTSTGICYSLK